MNHYLSDLKQAIGDRTLVELPMATVSHSRGLASSFTITHGSRTIDMSEGIDGEPMEGREYYSKTPDHTDEREEPILMVRPFPENEGDIGFLQSVIDAARESSNNPTA